ncbi:hypothetical protein RSOLAG1IB_09834 [Rhizoctonia solani AG-1 IB]|uniref:Uncharacterized protein n=1 Tax=Thanatephorus cucumeris (strain AG1-IB / isolate 7/3/14) TaxID=1108050 RepID=A0A0B7FTC1_THACB|nr:hypothetical protein RSOLAG1IB_09834 [Rhizoctonia solani AG-1 IB]
MHPNFSTITLDNNSDFIEVASLVPYNMREFKELLCYLYITFLGFSSVMARPIGYGTAIFSKNTAYINHCQVPNHGLSGVGIIFQGSAIRLYGPPRSQMFAAPITTKYRICLHESYGILSDIVCQQINISELYSLENNPESPVEIFAKSGLQYWEHRIWAFTTCSVDDPDHHKDFQLYYATYATEWSPLCPMNAIILAPPRPPRSNSSPYPMQPMLSRLPQQPPFGRPPIYSMPPIYREPPVHRPPSPSSFVLWAQVLIVFWMALVFSAKCIEVGSEQRERQSLLYPVRQSRIGNSDRTRNDSARAGPPPIYTRPPSYHTSESVLGGPRNAVLEPANLPPLYSDVVRQQPRNQ